MKSVKVWFGLSRLELAGSVLIGEGTGSGAGGGGRGGLVVFVC